VAEPVVGHRGEQIRDVAQLGAGEGGGDGVAAEGHSVVAGDGLVVALRHAVGEKGHIDIGLTNEERVHAECPRQ